MTTTKTITAAFTSAQATGYVFQVDGAFFQTPYSTPMSQRPAAEEMEKLTPFRGSKASLNAVSKAGIYSLIHGGYPVSDAMKAQVNA